MVLKELAEVVKMRAANVRSAAEQKEEGKVMRQGGHYAGSEVLRCASAAGGGRAC
jgi:hypothetical protein